MIFPSSSRGRSFRVLAAILVVAGIGIRTALRNKPAAVQSAPPPAAAVPDGAANILAELRKQFPWRQWGTLVKAKDNSSSFTIDYSLTEPEFSRYQGNIAPGGENLKRLRAIPIEFVILARSQGARGKFSSSGMYYQRVIHQGGGMTGHETGGYVFGDRQDIPEDPDTEIGFPRKHFSAGPLLEVTSETFPKQHAALQKKFKQLDALFHAAGESRWAGRIPFRGEEFSIRVRLRPQSILIEDATGHLLYECPTSGGGHYFVQEQDSGYDLFESVDAPAMYISAGAIADAVKQNQLNPFAAGPNADKLNRILFSDCRIVSIDATTISLAAAGIPATTLKKNN